MCYNDSCRVKIYCMAKRCLDGVCSVNWRDMQHDHLNSLTLAEGQISTDDQPKGNRKQPI